MSELRPCVRLTDDFDRVLGNVYHVGVETVCVRLTGMCIMSELRPCVRLESSGMCIMSELRPCVRLTDDFDRVLGNVYHVGVETVCETHR